MAPSRAEGPGIQDTARKPSESSSDAGDKLRGAAVVVVPVLLAALLTSVDLSGRSLWLDEAASVTIASQHGAALWAAMRHDGGNMLAYYALLHVLIGWFGTGAGAIRLASVVATAGTVLVVCLLGRRLFGRSVALAAGLLTAVSLPLVYWGQNARGYAFMVAFAAASFLGFVALVEAEPGSRRAVVAWLCYVVAIVLAVYMSFVAVLVVPAQLISLFWYRRRLKPVAFAVGVAAACCLPLGWLGSKRGSSQLFWVARPNLGDAGAIVQSLTSGAQPSFQLSATSIVLCVLTVALLVACAVRIRLGWSQTPEARDRWAQVLVLSWLVVPLVLICLESFVGQSVFQARYTLIALPAVSLLLAFGLLTTPLRAGVGWAALAVLLVLRGAQILPVYGASPENWRAATRYVLSQARPGDCVAFYPSDGRMAFRYYLSGGPGVGRPVPRPVLPPTRWASDTPFVEDYRGLSPSDAARLQATCSRVWLLSSHVGAVGATTASTAHLARFFAIGRDLGGAYGGYRTAFFGWTSPVTVALYFAPHSPPTGGG